MLSLLVSPSGAERRAAAEAFVRGFGAATEVVVVGERRGAVDDLVRRVASSSRATFGLHRFTLVQLAAQIAAPELAAAGRAPASSLAGDVGVARALFALEREGKTPRLAPLMRFPGLPRALTRTVRELRLSGIAPAAIAESGDGADVAEVLARFADQLDEAGAADHALLYAAAREAVRAGRGGSIAEAPVVLLDVALASPAAIAFVEALAARVPAMLATVPHGDDASAKALRERGAADVAPEEPRGGRLERLRRNVFEDARAVAEPEPAGEDGRGDVLLFSAPGEARECVEIARLALEEAGRGVRFDEMAVLLRTPEAYATPLETALARAEVPAYFARGVRRPDPSGRALLALLLCRAENLSARRFAEYLSLGQVPDLADDGAPPAAGTSWTPPRDDAYGLALGVDGAAAETPEPAAGADSDGRLRAPWRWEKLLVDAAVLGGRDRWARRLTGLARELRLRIETVEREGAEPSARARFERELENLAHLEAFVLPVIDMLAELPHEAIWGVWLEHLRSLASRTLRAPERVLAALAELAPLASVGPVRLDEVRRALLDRLTMLPEEPPASRYGRVLVGAIDDARGRSFRVVFVPGLAERVFPQRPREDPMLLDDLRARLSTDLPTQRERARNERLLLRLAVGAAEERVVLSYPRLDAAQGRARVTSFYGLDVVRATTGALPDPERLERDAEAAVPARLDWPAPRDPARAIDEIERDLAVISGAIADPEAAAGRVRFVAQQNEHLLRALRAHWKRWQPEWSSYDGVVSRSPENAATLDALSLRTRAYSATALQTFAACPYRLFLSAVQRLEPRKEPVTSERMDPLTRGQVFHDLLARLLRDVKDHALLPLTLATLPAAEALLDAVAADVSDETKELLAPPIPRVFRDEMAAMKAEARTLLQRLADGNDGFVPDAFELGFGAPTPVELPGGYLLRGRVDLLERSAAGDTWRVTDYKTGKDRNEKELVVGKGETLQPVLYALAIEKVTGRPVASSRLYYCTERGGYSERVVPIDAHARRLGSRVLQIIDGEITRGFLAPAPREEACSMCDFAGVCGPREEERFARKDARWLSRLAELRGMP